MKNAVMDTIRSSSRYMLSSTLIMVLGLVMAALAYYCIYVPSGAAIYGDTKLFTAVAADMHGSGLTKVHDVSPLYPAIMAALGVTSIGQGAVVMYVANSLFYIVTVLVLLRMSEFIGASYRQRAFLYLLSMLPVSWEIAMYVMPEVLTQTMLVLAVYYFVRYVCVARLQDIYVGMLFAMLAGLARASHQWIGILLVLIAAALCMVLHRSSSMRRMALRHLGLLGVMMVLTMAFPLYNMIKHGYLGSTYFAGYALTMNTALFIERLPREYEEARTIMIKARDAALVKPHSAHNANSYIHLVRADLKRTLGMNDVQLGQYLMEMNIVLIKSAPLQYLSAVYRSMPMFWFPQGFGEVVNRSSRLEQALWTFVYVVLIGMFIWVSVVLWGRYASFIASETNQKILIVERRHVAIIVSYVVIIYTWGITSLVAGVTTRYRVPIDPLVLLIIASSTKWLNISRKVVVLKS